LAAEADEACWDATSASGTHPCCQFSVCRVPFADGDRFGVSRDLKPQGFEAPMANGRSDAATGGGGDAVWMHGFHRVA